MLAPGPITTPGTDPYETVEWELRDARITNWKDGTDAFFQPGVEFPVTGRSIVVLRRPRVANNGA